ncbi:delta-like protein [Plakobranchus ocellatus]|uniref:Delta-like protein n=1 Tax=Plakobranchus ocellatus TaxID=259542 RepID=A0AAV3YVT8_9GAST|nr:delta-like protein [Plakobranchus ocellatus]
MYRLLQTKAITGHNYQTMVLGNQPCPVRRSVLISRLATIRTTVSGEAWSEFEETFEYGAKLRYAFRFQCNQNYYGPKCSTLCRPRDNEFGHLTCSPNGTMVCMEGWGGEYCDTAVLAATFTTDFHTSLCHSTALRIFTVKEHEDIRKHLPDTFTPYRSLTRNSIEPADFVLGCREGEKLLQIVEIDKGIK